MKKSGSISVEERRLVILRKLEQLGTMNLLEIGFNASPETIRSMAASGLVRVTVEIMPRGREAFQALSLKALRRSVKAGREARLQARAA